MKDLLARVRAGEMDLMSPFRISKNVIELMDELTPTAKVIGAVKHHLSSKW
ncbi:MAG: hypothetical protein U0Z26_06945 [Anaerolineales bacterium]